MNTVSYEDFVGDTYPLKKGILVTIFSKISPHVEGPAPKGIKGERKLQTTTQNDIDAEYLVKLFKEVHHQETAEVKIYNHQTKDDVTKYIQELDSSQGSSDYDVFIFVFLTYMSKPTKNTKYRDERIHLKGGMYSMEDFYNVAKKSAVMRMKPKIFLVQSDDLSLCIEKEIVAGPELVIEKKIPQDADRLIIMSDIPQKLANPDKNSEEKHPSFMIKAFGETLMENSKLAPEKRLDLLSLTPLMNQKVKNKIDEIKREDLSVPLVTSTLTKLIRI
ncbi:uncharacterized protein LOC132748971 [Ruditapes philippinarum]|uniref:uncharacterized protein LOC132748971 n=1 Tax=Ruditapes philippinarum TaxID=129788 RepID=UPI00295BB584|nr:uncharacterized protein LOC132748971 [Ruditapes philippinarum]